MNYGFSKRIETVKKSEVRELLKMTEKSDIISFGGGLPAEETFPVEEMVDICKNVIMTEKTKSMQYSTTEGNEALRQLIVKLMGEKGIESDADNILITSGSQQGLDLTAKIFIDEGDKIVCESPTYLSAINAFNPFYPQYLEIPMDENGMIIEELESVLLKSQDIKFIYTIPDYQNPTGVTLSINRRKRLVELANRYDLLIIEDNPYSEFRFEGSPLPPIKSFDTQGRVIYLSTFSKLVCPGYRIGWVCASKEILSKYVLFKQGTDLHTNIFSQMQIVEFYRTHDTKAHIQRSINIYKKRRDTMLKVIEEKFPKDIRYTKPEGGMFVWITLPEHMNSRELLEKALQKGVAFVPGEAFFPNGGNQNTMRLNFSSLSEDKIREGLIRLAEVFGAC